MPLADVTRIAQKTADSLKTVAMSLDRCSVPQREEQEGLGPGIVEYGMGIDLIEAPYHLVMPNLVTPLSDG